MADDYRAYEIAPGPLRVEGIKVLHGANYFSAGPVVIVRLNLAEYDEVFTDAIPGFFDKLRALLPSLEEHYCSPGKPGGFFERVRDGTLLGHVIEHVAIELQTLAGMDVGYGKTRGTATQGVYNVIFRFLDEHAGVYAAKSAVNAVHALLLDRPFEVAPAVDTLVSIRETRLLGPSTQAIVDEATRREIPHQRLDEYNLVQVGTGRYQKRIRATVTSDTSLLAVETAANKYLTVRMLADAGVPVPRTVIHPESIEGPTVVKPCEGTLGRGVTVGPADPQTVARAKEQHDEVLVQEFIDGQRYRLLVIDHQLVAAAELSPPAITGDGESTVTRLVERLNAEPERELGDKTPLTRVEIDAETQRLLAERGYTPETVLREGEQVDLKVSASLSLGGSSHDVTDEVHPFNRMLAERASRAIGLEVAGVDLIALDISKPLPRNGGAILGVSAGPDFRMHLTPARGEARPVAAAFVDMLFPMDRETRVPVAAVTGSTGSTVAARLIDHCLCAAHHAVGLACAEGFFVAGDLVIEGNLTGHESAGIALKDTSIDHAVFEVPVRTILDRGLGYGFADVGVVLNVLDTGESFDETLDLEDIAYAHSVLAEQVYDDGFAVLNADDELVLGMLERTYAPAVLFSRDRANPAIAQHVEAGGWAVILDESRLAILDRDRKIDLLPAEEVPAAAAHPDAVLGSVAALYALGVSVETLKESLQSFAP